MGELLIFLKEVALELGFTGRDVAWVTTFVVGALMAGYAGRYVLQRARETMEIGHTLRDELSKQLAGAHLIVKSQHEYIIQLRKSKERFEHRISELEEEINWLRRELEDAKSGKYFRSGGPRGRLN